ncbi:MAG: MBL fold metallo-hydrolase [bacterium]
MSVKITTIVENSVPVSIRTIGEHGLSFIIETEDRTILFDTGQGMALAHNAERMGTDLTKVDTVILSHGHYDHSGGLLKLLEINGNFELIVHPDAFSEKYALLPGPKTINIGMITSQKLLEEKNINVRLSREPVEICNSIMTTGEIPMETDYEGIEPVLFTRINGKNVPDPLLDDQCMILKVETGIIVVLGCAHRGIINTLNRVVQITGVKDIYAVLGGMHLERASDEQIEKTVEALKSFNIQRIGVSHCTGIRAITRLYREFGERVFLNQVGYTLKIQRRYSLIFSSI